ncbi:hypothetical protein BJ165DRAFT_559765 [Panaeolus papilionaceus]|nr:hypothetical protein BJ165DRAFT_559765 [Panaeolus papilionaceus]
MVAWCTKPQHGTRLIPAGALYGVQYTKTPDYVQVVGFIDQTKINMIAGDYGGEMDPHGADLRGNPMGGLVYTDKFTGSPIQGIEWHNFMGSNQFCFKVCDPAGPNPARYCEHILDRIGCAFNAPNNARNGTFESCDGESQDFPGVYTDAAGAVQTYTQPPESLGAITTMPYVARVPQSSNCQQFESASIFSGLPAVTPTGASSTPSSSGAAPTGSNSAKPSGNTPGGSSGSGSNTAPGASPTGGAGALSISLVAIAGSVFAALFFA